MVPWKPDLLKIVNFGDKLNGNEDGYFEWPSQTTINILGLTQPLKLEAIYVKWTGDYGICSLQLEFEGGVKSDLFDANRSSTHGETRVELKGLKVTSISSTIE